MKFEVYGIEGMKGWKVEHNLNLWEAREVAHEAQGCGYDEIIIVNPNGAIVERFHG